jgi:hypothetical protein
MGIGNWVLQRDPVTLAFYYTDGVRTVTPAVYEAYYPKITAEPDPPREPEVGDFWLDTTP